MTRGSFFCPSFRFPSSKEQMIAEVSIDDISAMSPSRVKLNLILGSWDGGASYCRGGASGRSRVMVNARGPPAGEGE